MDGMKFPNKFVENIYKANKVLGKVESVLSIALLWALIVVCMIFISCRFIFHYSTPWADELARYLLIDQGDGRRSSGRAIRDSIGLMRGQKMAFFKLSLR